MHNAYWNFTANKHIDRKKKHWYVNKESTIRINGTPIRLIKQDEHYKYQGINITHHWDHYKTTLDIIRETRNYFLIRLSYLLFYVSTNDFIQFVSLSLITENRNFKLNSIFFQQMKKEQIKLELILMFSRLNLRRSFFYFCWFFKEIDLK